MEGKVFAEILLIHWRALSMPDSFTNSISAMALSKQKLYPHDLQLTSNMARALGHSARLQILMQLYSRNPLCVQEIGEKHPLSPEALSGHLKILREAGLVIWYERFPYTYYSLHNENWKQAMEWLNTFFAFFNTEIKSIAQRG